MSSQIFAFVSIYSIISSTILIRSGFGKVNWIQFIQQCPSRYFVLDFAKQIQRRIHFSPRNNSSIVHKSRNVLEWTLGIYLGPHRDKPNILLANFNILNPIEPSELSKEVIFNKLTPENPQLNLNSFSSSRSNSI